MHEREGHVSALRRAATPGSLASVDNHFPTTKLTHTREFTMLRLTEAAKRRSRQCVRCPTLPVCPASGEACTTILSVSKMSDRARGSTDVAPPRDPLSDPSQPLSSSLSGKE